MSPIKRSALFILLAGVLAFSQTPATDSIPAIQAAIDFPTSVAVDRSGDLFISSLRENRIYKVGSDGILRVIAGNGLAGFSGDGGPATAARMNQPFGIAVDSKGNVYVADQINYRVRKITPDGLIQTVAGDGNHGYNGDGGPAVRARITIPHHLAVDTQDNLYISLEDGLRKIDTNGVITTVSAKSEGQSIAIDKSGNLYTVGTNRVSKITPDGATSVVAGNERGGPTSPGTATGGPLGGPTAIAVDGEGNLYIATGYNRIWKVSKGRISLFAGGGKEGTVGDGGPATSGRLQSASALAVDGAGNVYIADSGNHRVRRISTTGRIETVAGTGLSGFRGDGGPAALARLVNPSNIAIDSADNLYIAEQCRIRKVTRLAVISTVAGMGVCGFGGDGGPATAAQLSSELGLGIDSRGNLYIADAQNHRIRRVASNGIISTVAGSGREGQSGDGGSAGAAQLRFPLAVAVDAGGSFYIGDGSVRKVTPDGIISTLISGQAGYGGAVTEALKWVGSIAIDSAGNIFVADTTNYRIRRLAPNGVLTTVAGVSGALGFSGDGGPATLARLNMPRGVALDKSGNVYIADTFNGRVRKVTPGGTISTIAGDRSGPFGGDGGPATSAQLSASSVALDSVGNLYVADQASNRIRKITPDGVISTFVGIGPPTAP